MLLDILGATLSMLRLSFIARSLVSSSGIVSAKITVVALEPDADNSMSDVVLNGTFVPFPRLVATITKMNKRKTNRNIYIQIFSQFPTSFDHVVIIRRMSNISYSNGFYNFLLQI